MYIHVNHSCQWFSTFLKLRVTDRVENVEYIVNPLILDPSEANNLYYSSYD